MASLSALKLGVASLLAFGAANLAWLDFHLLPQVVDASQAPPASPADPLVAMGSASPGAPAGAGATLAASPGES
ncbi:MAG TPA: hypothetical protein PKU97_16865, partial [Kofleriaceae bacterium]|nr:hypothetical protein [Kofleriaceae bacterium]